MPTIPKPIKVTYESTSDLNTAEQWLKDLDQKSKPIALDFEAAVKYSKEDIESAKKKLEQEDLEFYERIRLQQLVKATALSHPSHSYPTHLSIGLSESEALVIIIDTFEMLYLVLEWLVETEITQIWHNASYDFKHIYYHMNKFPKNYEDTQILAKTILNHVENFKAKTGLKELAGYKYGDWAISVDNFTVKQMYEEHVLKYAAIDGCATYWLWEAMQEYIKEQ